MKYSRLAGREVSTWSGRDEAGETAGDALWRPGEGESARGMKHTGGDAAVAQLVSEIERYKILVAQ